MSNTTPTPSLLNSDQEIRTSYAEDAAGNFMLPDFVARPKNAQEVSEILRYANANTIGITPSGGRSS